VITSGNNLWEYHTFLKYWSNYRLEDAYQNLIPSVTGGVKCKNNFTWFFKGISFEKKYFSMSNAN
jgi:hypothetical protein